MSDAVTREIFIGGNPFKSLGYENNPGSDCVTSDAVVTNYVDDYVIQSRTTEWRLEESD